MTNPSDWDELQNVTDEGYEELIELCRFCLITRTPYREARQWPDVLLNAFIDAQNQINDELK